MIRIYSEGSDEYAEIWFETQSDANIAVERIRVVRPKGQGGYGQAPKVRAVDALSNSDIPGAQIVRQRDFIGVVAPPQWDAIRAAEQLKVDWELPASLPGDAKVHAKLRSASGRRKCFI